MSIKVDVGTPSSNFEGWTTAEVCFHDFADLSTAIGERVRSPEFSCFGHQWRVVLYPGGKADSYVGNVAVILCNMSSKSIKIQWRFSVRDAADKEVVYHKPQTEEFDAWDDGDDVQNAWGTFNFARRSKLLDALIEGAFVVEVRMKLIGASKLSTQFIPSNPLNKNIFNKFNDEESADVVFEVGSGSKEGGNNCKKAKTFTNFYAHRLILQDISTTLAEMCKPSADGGSVATASITDVKPDIFKHMLYYVYGGKLTDEELKVNAKEIIDACDKYGIVHLKLEAEACYVKSTTITVENMMDNLLYADCKNCALLKEAVIDFVVENGKDVLKKVSLKDVPGSVFADLLTAMTREKDKVSSTNDEQDLSMMRVSELRMKLDEMGLDVDGSREAMIALLEENA